MSHGSNMLVTGTGGPAAVHALHTAEHANHLANSAVAVAAFTAMAWVEKDSIAARASGEPALLTAQGHTAVR
jgi:hypothetical protein